MKRAFVATALGIAITGASVAGIVHAHTTTITLRAGEVRIVPKQRGLTIMRSKNYRSLQEFAYLDNGYWPEHITRYRARGCTLSSWQSARTRAWWVECGR